MRDGIEPLIAKVGTYQSRVLLLDEPVIVLVEGAAAGKVDTLDSMLPEADEVVVEELAAVIWVDLNDRKGETLHRSSRSAERR